MLTLPRIAIFLITKEMSKTSFGCFLLLSETSRILFKNGAIASALEEEISHIKQGISTPFASAQKLLVFIIHRCWESLRLQMPHLMIRGSEVFICK